MRQKLSTEDFVNKAGEIHNQKYSYDLFEYQSHKTKGKITCPRHGIFEQQASDHLRGHGCPKCYGNKKFTQEDFLHLAQKTHGDRYLYDKFVYKNARTPAIIICKKHGEFLQRPREHIKGQGCKRCNLRGGKPRLSKEEFIRRATKKHGNKYDYSEFEYISRATPGKIICPDHGEFMQRPENHADGQGCPRCSCGPISRSESRWLSSLGFDTADRNKRIPLLCGKIRVPDAFDEITNTVYLYHGDFWHGNIRKYPPCMWNPIRKKFMWELHQETIREEREYKDSGYKIVSVWESDFLVPLYDL